MPEPKQELLRLEGDVITQVPLLNWLDAFVDWLESRGEQWAGWSDTVYVNGEGERFTKADGERADA